MMKKIIEGTVPNFFYINYSKENFQIKTLFTIPKHYFVKDIITKNKPLKDTAKRKGWVGCNIEVSKIPESGKIYLVKDGIEIPKDEVIKQYNKMMFLQKVNENEKRWLLDIIKCIEFLDKKEFSLKDLCAFEAALKLKHPDNNNIKPKICQQLQVLRDAGYLTFLGKGYYRLVY